MRTKIALTDGTPIEVNEDVNDVRDHIEQGLDGFFYCGPTSSEPGRPNYHHFFNVAHVVRIERLD